MTDTAIKTKPQEKAQPRLKEQEPKTSLGEIPSRTESVDNEAILALRESIKEVELATPDVKLPPDLEDAGVVSPQQAADDVISKGPTLDIALSEEEFKKGEKESVGGKSDKQKVVFGASSLVALAIWVKRAIKLAHKHTMRVVFRKGDDK